ncbi:hypothetical protein [Confluentibacter lentus]|uniref:hypothetical protein n=1 Tax=Confluentibacter lentus TaxID=1699412 RepID=UPI000C28B4E8|nr:hypothetical protein [Confluentibacter lentus]
MKLRWGILLGVITLIGIASQQQVYLPNQEIVLRFANDEVTSNEAQNAISIVKRQLLNIGASNIYVKKSRKGDLKITYYSHKDVHSIKKLLSKEKDLELDYIASNQENNHSETPSKENTKSYDIDVFEIKKQDTGFDLGGTCAIERKLENTRFFIPNLLTSNNEIGFNGLDRVLKETYKFRKDSSIAIEITSNKTPDGRAGPDIKGVPYNS